MPQKLKILDISQICCYQFRKIYVKKNSKKKKKNTIQKVSGRGKFCAKVIKMP